MGAALFFTSQSKLLSPIPLTGLSAWWIGDNALHDGSNYVSQNNDVSINGNNQTQTTGASQPLFVANAKNGHAAIRHDGSNDFLNFTPISNIRTVFAVLKNTNPPASSTLLGHTTLYDWHPGVDTSGGRFLNPAYSAVNVKTGSSYFNGIKKKALDIIYPQDYSIISFVTKGNAITRPSILIISPICPVLDIITISYFSSYPYNHVRAPFFLEITFDGT